MENSKKVIATAQVRDSGGLDQDDKVEMVKSDQTWDTV